MDIRALVMGLLFALMWSSAFTSARIIVAHAPPLGALALRFLISGLLAVLIARMMGQSWRLSPSQWRATIIFGICQNALYLGLNFVAMQKIEASLAAIIASTMPLWVALAGWLIFREKLRAMTILGLMGGFVGVTLIMGSRFGGGADPMGVLLCFIGVLALTVATLTLRGATSGGNFLMVVGLQMLVGSAALWPFAVSLEEFDVTWSTSLLVAFAYTTVVPGLAATLVWFHLVNRVGTVRAATFHFLNPFFGVAIAALLLSERLGLLDLIGVAIITGGIFVVQRSRLERV
ncbi:MAG: DMT family transporter [Pelagimonas sp.]|jgi:drug/metabolite transporter (DMT)-like permease|nr:DMT family transporter [Pelagimonas sp.]